MKTFIAQIIIAISLFTVPAQATPSKIPSDKILNAFPDGCVVQPLPQRWP
jgi:hypothetical protein